MGAVRLLVLDLGPFDLAKTFSVAHMVVARNGTLSQTRLRRPDYGTTDSVLGGTK